MLGGFTESQLGPNVWRVTFLGNGMRTVDEVRDMVLLRSAELVRDAGYSHFAVRQSQDQSSSVGLGVGTVSGGVFLSMFQPIKHPEISAIVEARNQPGTGNDFVYDADYLLKSLGSKYRQK